MPENGMPGPVCDLSSVREAVCIHTHKIFDSCRDKDCVEDLRFYPTASAQEVLSACQMVRGGTAELLYVYTDVEPVTFNRGFYSIDMRFFYRVTLQVGTGTPRCTEAEGLCVFDKRVILFGSEGSAADRKETAQTRPITYTDLYDWGVSGTANSAETRRRLLRRLGLPPRLSKKELLQVLNTLYTYDSLNAEIEKL